METTCRKRSSIEDEMLYAITLHDDETITLTVFENADRAASINLSKPFVKQLIESLTHHVQ